MERELVEIILTREEQNNLLVMLDSVQVKGIRSAQEYLNIIHNIQTASPRKVTKVEVTKVVDKTEEE
jgi:hypothetical protein